jgi:hypothetical protein
MTDEIASFTGIAGEALAAGQAVFRNPMTQQVVGMTLANQAQWMDSDQRGITDAAADIGQEVRVITKALVTLAPVSPDWLMER